jgi:gelsolin
VFFWLGAETSQDEAGTAAYKTVELDDLLGDEPVQYREVQGNESKKFLDLFPKISILAGGVESGFRNVKPQEYKPRLLHVTGYKKHVQVYQVALKAENLNNSDSFVLDAGLSVYQFNGTKSSAWEKRKANAIVDELQASRHGKVKTTLIIDGIEDTGNPLIEEFWAYFGGRPKQIKAEEEEKKVPDYTLSLHHISDASGVMEIKEVCKGKLDKSKLDPNDAFILDAGGSLFVWIGKGANKAEKREAMKYAVQYLTDQGRGADVPIARVMDGKEPSEFWSAFNGKPVLGRANAAQQWKK